MTRSKSKKKNKNKSVETLHLPPPIDITPSIADQIDPTVKGRLIELGENAVVKACIEHLVDRVINQGVNPRVELNGLKFEIALNDDDWTSSSTPPPKTNPCQELPTQQQQQQQSRESILKKMREDNRPPTRIYLDDGSFMDVDRKNNQIKFGESHS